MKRRMGVVLAMMAAVLTGTASSAGAATPEHGVAMEVEGEFISLGGAPTGVDPDTGEFTAIGISTVSGDWNGYWYEEIRFTLDQATGDAHGTVTQVFTGSASDGTSGSLAVFERFTVDGDTHVLVGEGEILGGSGDWQGSRGSYSAEGTVSGAGPGTWRARWIRPRG